MEGSSTHIANSAPHSENLLGVFCVFHKEADARFNTLLGNRSSGNCCPSGSSVIALRVAVMSHKKQIKLLQMTHRSARKVFLGPKSYMVLPCLLDVTAVYSGSFCLCRGLRMCKSVEVCIEG